MINNLQNAILKANYIPLRTKLLDDVCDMVTELKGHFGETTKMMYAVLNGRVFQVVQVRSGEYVLQFHRNVRAVK